MFVHKGFRQIRRFGSIPGYLLFAFIFLTISSCRQKPKGFLSSSAYNKAVDTATIMYDNGRHKAAVDHLDSAFRHSDNLGFKQVYNYYYFIYTYASHVKNDRKMALLYADSMLNIFDTPEKKLKFTSEYGQAHLAKGDVLFDERRYNEAYGYFYEGKVIANNNLDDCTMGDYSYRMGMILYKQEHYSRAASYFKKSFEETTSCEGNFNYFYRRQELLNNIGLSYSKMLMNDSAMYFYKTALDYINNNTARFKDRPQMAEVSRGVVYGNMADISIRQKDYNKAKNLLKKGIAINLRKGNDNNDAQYSELKLASIYDKQNANDSLLNILNIIRLQFDSIKSPETRQDWHLLMSNYFEKQNDHQQAMFHYKQYDELKDTIANENKILKESDVAEQVKSLEKDNEFNNLKKNNELQHVYLRVTVVFALMLIIIISLVFLNWQKSKKNIKTLGGLNNQINHQNHHLEIALNDLKLNNEEKDRILRTVAHDLRNPIGGIASLTGAMTEENYSDEQKELLNIIRETSFNSIELINEILEATESVSVMLNKEAVEVNSLLSNSVELMRFKAAEKQQVISLAMLSSPLEICISREKIWRVISNLISNAIKFSPEGSAIFVMAIEREKEILISVKDHGIGIPDKLKSQVFNMFTDAKRPGTSGEKSFGLGLSICRQIIEEHNGQIWFESDTENGTSFKFTLPKD
ncbi:HAMP domain-containing histidine kinase [Mucilaginibacter sp. SMC90]|uniref:tetratricopeptide repeat-containing sensor histidine kinase n=1 Tax=Mucilaginibacter sp. SMC90 TaxID=2929803 RepID=UPI001FB2E0B7|nr:HAMP domain-containing sensor histidine kinase [Mucilaginibacter sp. SMC90]UOE46353.1 HAMP domain-containing histidine kinase [Mucilaginibacter sp. SMC90]